MASIFNFFKSGGAYSKSNTGATSSSTSSTSGGSSSSSSGGDASSGTSSNETPLSSPSPNDKSAVIVETNKEVIVDQSSTSKEKSTSSQIVDGKNLILSIQPDSRPVFNEADLTDLIKLKEHLQYKPSVLNLIAVYQAEIQKHVEYGVKKPNKKVLNYQIEPAPTNTKYVYLTTSGLPGVYCTNNDMLDYSHYQALKEGKSVTHSFDSQDLPKIEETLKNQTQISSNSSITNKRKELEQLEKQYTLLMREKEKLLIDRAAVLSPEELAIIEEEEGKNRISNQDDDQWEIERKKRIIENERKLIEKRLADAKKHRNVRFYCKGELEYLTKWNDHFVKTNSETAPKGLDDMLRYKLNPTNCFDLGAEEIHYRFCESQFHRLAANPLYGSSYPTAKLINVEYVVNPVIMRRFNACKQELAKKHGFMLESMKPLLLFHGTSDTNMENILRTNFLLNKIGKSLHF